MIIELSDSVKRLVIQKRDAERLTNLLEDLDATISALNAVRNQSLELKSYYQLVQEKLSNSNRSSIQSQVKGLIGQIQTSHKDFATARRQLNVLRNIQENLARLFMDTKTSWKLAADEILKPNFDLYSLVRKLPDFQSWGPPLNILKERLEYFQATAPQDSSEMREFDQKVNQFNKGLTSIEGLTPKIRAFLAKMVNNTATLTDLDDEVLAWCRQAGRSKAFMITFRG